MSEQPQQPAPPLTAADLERIEARWVPDARGTKRVVASDVPSLCAALRGVWRERDDALMALRFAEEQRDSARAALHDQYEVTRLVRENLKDAESERARRIKDLKVIDAKNADLCEQRDAALIAMSRAQEQRDALKAERDALRLRVQAVEAVWKEAERDALRAEVERLRRGMEGLSL